MVNKIFLKFSIFYGHIWRSQYKNDSYSSFARKEWLEALAGFDKELVDEAIHECLKNRELPPTLAQFIDCCKQLRRKQTDFQREEAPLIKANPLVVEAQLKKMKAILNMPQ